MSLSTVIKTGLSILLDNPILVEGAQKKAIAIIKEHFTYSSEEIYQAYQDSYGYSITAITAGLAAPDKKLLAIVQKVLYAKVTREFAEPIERNYFQAFAKKRGVPANDNSALRQQLIDELHKIAKVTFFKVESEADLSVLINYQGSVAITELILEKISPLDDTLAEFLRHEELLGKAILFFFRELMRKDERLYKTQAALQRENLCLEVKNIQGIVESAKTNLSQAIEDNSDNLVVLAQEVKYLRQAQATWQARSEVLIDFPAWQNLVSQQLEQLLDGIGKVHGKLDSVHEDVKTTKTEVELIRAMLEELLQRQNLSTQLNPRDEFTQHNSDSLKLIQKAASQFKNLSKNDPNYSQVSIMLGSALSSTGDLKKAERLFEEVLEKSSLDSERALAHFNLFQVQLRRKDYAQSVKHLQEAIRLDYGRFALHNARKYPPIRLLGAGGMGVVFLCENKNFLLKKIDKVVVKCFWETLKGSSEEVFKEPLAMSEIAGDYVPESFDYGYMDDFNQERGFFVTEYIDGAMDGEAWLEKYGPLNVKTGLSVALSVAKGLELAHKKGIFHLDLKPANLLLKRSDSGVEVKIIDFGLSQVASSLGKTAIQQSRSGLSFFGQAILGGTLDYSPPEQQSYECYLEPSAKNDVFAFGMTFYRLFTNERPRPFLSHALPQNVEALRDLLCDCVAHNPDKRPDSAVVLVRKLEEISVVVLVRKLEEIIASQNGKFFQFEVVSVNAQGKITNRTKKQANYETENLPNGVILDMVSIPGGTFMMGSPESEKDRSNNEKQHEVTISPFYMGKYQVTQAQWQAVMGNNPSHFKGDNRPVESVSWDDAMEFCNKVSELTGETFRLATEAEWEYACRAGTTTPFYFGETITTDLVNSDGNYPYGAAPKGVYRGETTDVGSFPPNAFGIYDMHGNVWEWTCSEYHDKYQGDENKRKSYASLFVPRGGSWINVPSNMRSANRFRFRPTDRGWNFGFRLIRTPNP